MRSGDFASAKYKLNKKATLFRGGVAIDDNSGRIWGKAVFEIYGNGKQLWVSKPIASNRVIQEFSINVSQVDVLELRVTALESHTNVHAVWLDARLLQKDNTPDK